MFIFVLLPRFYRIMVPRLTKYDTPLMFSVCRSDRYRGLFPETLEEVALCSSSNKEFHL